jgi:hypothetical protein
MGEKEIKYVFLEGFCRGKCSVLEDVLIKKTEKNNSVQFWAICFLE